LVLTGHIHLAEVLSFTGGRAPQIVAGIGGTRLLPEVTATIVDTILDGERVTHSTTGSTHGFMTLEPVRPENPKLFTDLTFSAFLLMLDQRTSPSSDTLW
jgi:hypothetical protein